MKYLFPKIWFSYQECKTRWTHGINNKQSGKQMSSLIIWLIPFFYPNQISEIYVAWAGSIKSFCHFQKALLITIQVNIQHFNDPTRFLSLHDDNARFLRFVNDSEDTVDSFVNGTRKLLSIAFSSPKGMISNFSPPTIIF